MAGMDIRNTAAPVSCSTATDEPKDVPRGLALETSNVFSEVVSGEPFNMKTNNILQPDSIWLV